MIGSKVEHRNCIWRIKATTGYRINIKINEFNIKPANKTCKNYIAIYDGYTTKSRILLKTCGSKLIQTEFTTTQPYLIVQYISNNPIERSLNRFKATYKSIFFCLI